MTEQITVYKLAYDDDGTLPPMYVGNTLPELLHALDTMLDGAELGTIVIVELTEVDKEWFDALEPWEA